MIIVYHWNCGDGCCSGTDFEVHYETEEYDGFATLSDAINFCEERNWPIDVMHDYSREHES